jgi:hypothetical protein
MGFYFRISSLKRLKQSFMRKIVTKLVQISLLLCIFATASMEVFGQNSSDFRLSTKREGDVYFLTIYALSKDLVYFQDFWVGNVRKGLNIPINHPNDPIREAERAYQITCGNGGKSTDCPDREYPPIDYQGEGLVVYEKNGQTFYHVISHFNTVQATSTAKKRK